MVLFSSFWWLIYAKQKNKKKNTTNFFADLLLSDEGISCCIMEIALGAASYTELHGAATCALNANDCNHVEGERLDLNWGRKRRLGRKLHSLFNRLTKGSSVGFQGAHAMRADDKR